MTLTVKTKLGFLFPTLMTLEIKCIILCLLFFRDTRIGRVTEVNISDEDILNFLRKKRIDESSMVKDFTDTTIMPSDLYDKSHPHNGKH